MIQRVTLVAICAASLVSSAARSQTTDAADIPLESPVEYVARRLPEVLPQPPEQGDQAELTLSDAEGLALEFNPTLAAAAARIRAARCQCWQVGQPPNPQLGYAAGEVGDGGAAGQQGIYAGQQFIRGDKLSLNRAVASREVMRLEQEFAAQQGRVLTDVRIAFFEAFLAQRRTELTHNLVEVSQQSVAAARALIEAQEGRRIDLLQSEIEGQRAAVDLANAESELRSAWRRLAAVVGQPELAEIRLNADIETLHWQLTWRESLDQLLRESPEVASALATVEKARWTLARERAEPISDVNTQFTVQYDDGSSDTIAGIQVSFPVPLWNRNEGGICRAQAEITAAQRQLDSVELKLQQRLANEFLQYETALAKVETLRNDILPRASENLELVIQGYRAGELAFLDFLTVQRTYFQTNLEYLAALGQLNRSVQLLNGRLLSNAFDN